MSVALLTRRKPVETCDELEAFLYVIIYYASRYLKSEHDGDTIAAFLDAFFDTYTLNSGRYTCGPAKREAIQNGQLTIDAETQLEFKSPMDKLLTKLLSWFRARHIVTKYDRTAAPASQPSGLLPAFDPTQFDDDNNCVPEPSPQERRLSDLLLEQRIMEDTLTNAAALKTWVQTDKVGDRIPPDWKVTDKLYGPTVQSTRTATSKRPRTEQSAGWSTRGMASAPTGTSSMPPPRSTDDAGLSDKRKGRKQ